MNEAAEDNHDGDSKTKRGGVGKDEYHKAFADKTNSLEPEASAHSRIGISFIGAEASKSAGEQVHPSKERCNGCSGLCGEFKSTLEVQSCGIVHGELDSKAGGVLDEEQPGVDISSAGSKGGRGGYFSH